MTKTVNKKSKKHNSKKVAERVYPRLQEESEKTTKKKSIAATVTAAVTGLAVYELTKPLLSKCIVLNWAPAALGILSYLTVKSIFE